MAECLISVLDCIADEKPGKDWGKCELAYCTAKRVIGARISETPLE
jgi:hypothetical protein